MFLVPVSGTIFLDGELWSSAVSLSVVVNILVLVGKVALCLIWLVHVFEWATVCRRVNPMTFYK